MVRAGTAYLSIFLERTVATFYVLHINLKHILFCRKCDKPLVQHKSYQGGKEAWEEIKCNFYFIRVFSLKSLCFFNTSRKISFPFFTEGER